MWWPHLKDVQYVTNSPLPVGFGLLAPNPAIIQPSGHFSLSSIYSTCHTTHIQATIHSHITSKSLACSGLPPWCKDMSSWLMQSLPNCTVQFLFNCIYQWTFLAHTQSRQSQGHSVPSVTSRCIFLWAYQLNCFIGTITFSTECFRLLVQQRFHLTFQCTHIRSSWNDISNCHNWNGTVRVRVSCHFQSRPMYNIMLSSYGYPLSV